MILEVQSHGLRLFDITGEIEYEVFSNQEGAFPDRTPDIKKGVFIEYVQKQGVKEMCRNNPKKLALAFELNKNEYLKFKDFFGDDEVFLKGNEALFRDGFRVIDGFLQARMEKKNHPSIP